MGTRCDAYGEAGMNIYNCAFPTGGFAAKWHRRINGYDSGPSEPSDSPSNGIIILRLWPVPISIPFHAATICLIPSIYGYKIDEWIFALK
ncbi:hypothetical protein M5K25_001843 [Dendrobium thyrsiflorum]|uniref:Uncharacterized protein n=1 Tax=Dendrobium thyrsiflorum TaxID=117978 RepID=A0ABD0VSU0_DENTH